MGDDEGFVESGSDFGGVERFVQNMAVEAPVAAEDEEYALAGGGGDAKSFGDFLVGVDTLGIDFLIFERLTEARGGGVCGNAEVPQIALTEPVLHRCDELLFGGGALFHGKGELDNEGVNVGSRLLLLNDLGREIGEALGFEGRPKSDFVKDGHGLFAGAGDVWSGRFGVKSAKGGGIAGKDRGAPFFEGSEGSAGGGLMRGGCGGHEESDEK